MEGLEAAYILQPKTSSFDDRPNVRLAILFFGFQPPSR